MECTYEIQPALPALPANACITLSCCPAGAGILNVFGGVLTFKRKAEEALEASGMPYVIVRPGECAFGMLRVVA